MSEEFENFENIVMEDVLVEDVELDYQHDNVDNIVVGHTINEAVEYDDVLSRTKRFGRFSNVDIKETTTYSLTETGIGMVTYNPDDHVNGMPDAKYWQKHFKEVCPVPFKVTQITDIYTLGAGNVLDMTASNSSRRKVTIVAHNNMDRVNYRLELPMHAFQDSNTAKECLKDFLAKGGMDFNISPPYLPRLQEYLALSTKKCFEDSNTPDHSLYEGSGWVLDGSVSKEDRYKHLVTYTAPGLSNNANKGGWRHTNGNEDRMKHALRCAITNTRLNETEPLSIAELKATPINEILVMAMAWTCAGMLRVTGLANQNESHILSLVGTAGGDGKTTTLNIASSLMGNRSGSGINTQDTTLLSLKDTVREGNHSTIVIDELTNISGSRGSAKVSSPDEFRILMIGLTEIYEPGRKKVKDSKETSGYSTFVDNPAFVLYLCGSNGSINLKLKDCKDDQKGAIAARNIEVMVVKSEESRNGREGHVMFKRNITDSNNNLTGDAERVRYIDEIVEELKNHYGFALPYFVQYIQNNAEYIKELLNRYGDEYNSLGLAQNRQARAYAMMETLKIPLLNYLGFDEEASRYIGQEVTHFIKNHIVPHNNKIAEQAAGRLDVEDTLDLLYQLVMNRKNMIAPTKNGMYLMGDDTDLASMNAAITRDHNPWRPSKLTILRRSPQGDYLGFDTWTPQAQLAFSEFHAHENRIKGNKDWIRYEQTMPMTAPYAFNEILSVNMDINTDSQIKTTVKLEDIKKSAKEQGWLIPQKNGTKFTDAWRASGTKHYKFNIQAANALIAAASSQGNAVTEVDTMTDGDDVE